MSLAEERNPKGRGVHGTVIAALAVCVLPLATAQADTIADFTWVEASGSGGHAEKGSLTLDLPGTVTLTTMGTFPFQTTGFEVANPTFAELTELSYTFSDGVTTVQLGDFTSKQFNPATGTDPAWAAATVQSFTAGGSGLGDTDLITGFTLSGANNLKIAEAQGTLTNIQAGSNQQTLVNDSGYWKLVSLTPVPLPAALPLLLSGFGLVAGALRGRTAGQATWPVG